MNKYKDYILLKFYPLIKSIFKIFEKYKYDRSIKMTNIYNLYDLFVIKQIGQGQMPEYISISLTVRIWPVVFITIS